MIGGRARAGLVIGLIVVCSALAGAAADRMLLQRMSHRRGGPGGPGGGGGGRGGSMSRESDQRRRADMLDRMTTSLSLTPAQRAGIDSVMQRTDSSLRAIRAQTQPEIQRVFERSRVDIAARLDSAQRVKHAESFQRRRR